MMLPPIENMDAVTCCKVVDIDFDGKNEVIVGTYANEILVYKEKEVGYSTVLQRKQTSYFISNRQLTISL